MRTCQLLLACGQRDIHSCQLEYTHYCITQSKVSVFSGRHLEHSLLTQNQSLSPVVKIVLPDLILRQAFDFA